MIEEKEKKESGEITRREFLKDAGLVVGGAAIGSSVLLAACAGEEVTKTVEVPGPTKTVTVEVPAEVAAAKMVLEWDADKCSMCGVCEYFCSTYHERGGSKYLSRITLHRYLPDITFNIETCKQCISPSCMAACAVPGAMYIDETTGARCIDEEKCIGCGLCAEACPRNELGGVIKYNAVKNTYVKCDMCSGRPEGPACVQVCWSGACTVKTL